MGLLLAAAFFCIIGDVYSAVSNSTMATTIVPCTPPSTPETQWTKETFPNPQVNVSLCGRNCRKSWICDPNDVLDNVQIAEKIDMRIKQTRTNGKCGCYPCESGGFKLSVALVEKIKFQAWETVTPEKKKEAAKEFAGYLRSTSWHTGKCDDDVVIFVSKEDKQVYTSVGPKARDVLTLNCTGAIYNEVKSNLSDGNYAKAVYRMVERYGEVFEHLTCYPPPQEYHGDPHLVYIAFVAIPVVLIIILVAVLLVRRRRGTRYHQPGHSTTGDRTTPEDPEKKESFEGGEAGDGGHIAGGGF